MKLVTFSFATSRLSLYVARPNSATSVIRTRSGRRFERSAATSSVPRRPVNVPASTRYDPSGRSVCGA